MMIFVEAFVKSTLTLTIQWSLSTRDKLGTGTLSLVERWSSSWRLSLKGNRNGKKKFFLFAFFSSPTSINMCGKRLKLLVKYALSCGQPNYEFLQYILLWAWPSDDARIGTLRVTSIAIVCFWAAEK